MIMFSNAEAQHPAIQMSVYIEASAQPIYGNTQGILIAHSINYIMFWYITNLFSRKEIINIHILLY